MFEDSIFYISPTFNYQVFITRTYVTELIFFFFFFFFFFYTTSFSILKNKKANNL